MASALFCSLLQENILLVAWCVSSWITLAARREDIQLYVCLLVKTQNRQTTQLLIICFHPWLIRQLSSLLLNSDLGVIYYNSNLLLFGCYLVFLIYHLKTGQFSGQWESSDSNLALVWTFHVFYVIIHLHLLYCAEMKERLSCSKWSGEIMLHVWLLLQVLLTFLNVLENTEMFVHLLELFA